MRTDREEPLLTSPNQIPDLSKTISDIPGTGKSSFISSSEHKGMIIELSNMGFDLEMIEMCFCFFTITSTDQAILLMTKEAGVWQHEYIAGEDKNCVVCKEYADHLDFKINRVSNNLNNFITIRSSNVFNNRASKITDEKSIYKSPEEISILIKENGHEIIHELFECQVCFCETDTSSSFSLSCKHIFCIECWFYYLEEKILKSDVVNINCMMKDCPIILPEKDLKKLLQNDSGLLEKYEKFKFNREIMTNSQMKFCPVVNCGGFSKKEKNEEESDKFVKCNNGHEFCFQCLKKWHDKKKCEDLLDQDFEKWKKGKFIKQCPSCKFWTEKNLGCNHMTCRGCNYQWCWICEGNYTSGHYNTLGACNGLQYSKKNYFLNSIHF
jgi:hypothetical protein